MKRVVNSYSARSSAKVRSIGLDRARILRPEPPRFPNYGWLAMIILAVAALSYTAYTNSRDIEREARSAYFELSEQVENAKFENKRIKDQTQRIKQNHESAVNAEQNQTRMLRRNEVVVAPR